MGEVHYVAREMAERLERELRDYFAGQALAGILGCMRDYKGCEPTVEGRVDLAYRYADAMMIRRRR